MSYSVTWETELIEAESPFAAAQEALDQIQYGMATCFTVLNEQTGEMHSVDLSEDEENAVLTVVTYESVFERNELKKP